MWKIYMFLKEKWWIIIIFIIINIFTLITFIITSIFWSIAYFTLLSFWILFLLSFLLFEKKYKAFSIWYISIFITQVCIALIPFSKCSYDFKWIYYNCKCSGLEKNISTWTECIWKITKCYDYRNNENLPKSDFWKNYETNKFHEEFKVSCEDFPEKLFNTY